MELHSITPSTLFESNTVNESGLDITISRTDFKFAFTAVLLLCKSDTDQTRINFKPNFTSLSLIPLHLSILQRSYAFSNHKHCIIGFVKSKMHIRLKD